MDAPKIESKAMPEWVWRVNARSLLVLDQPVYEAEDIEIGDGEMVATCGGRKGRLVPSEVTTPTTETVLLDCTLETTECDEEPCTVSVPMKVYAAALKRFAERTGVRIDAERMKRALGGH